MEQEIENMDMKENQLKNSVGAIVEEMEELTAIRLEMNERIALSKTNIEVILKTKQGRDEVKQEAVVTEYSEALVVPESIISELNSNIRELGEGKMEVLTKIKDFNKEINHMLWECTYLKMMVRHTDEKYLDYHMLR